MPPSKCNTGECHGNCCDTTGDVEAIVGKREERDISARERAERVNEKKKSGALEKREKKTNKSSCPLKKKNAS